MAKVNQSQIDTLIRSFVDNPHQPKKEWASKLNIHPASVNRILDSNNIYHYCPNTWTRKYSCDSNYFSTIDTKEKAYWLGFLYADGCISKEKTINFNLDSVDYDSVLAFKTAIKANNPIFLRKRKINYGPRYGIKVSTMAIFRFRDHKMLKDLDKLGCANKKTLILTFPTEKIVPDAFIDSFILGYFDGDGSVYETKTGESETKTYYSPAVSVTSTLSILEGIKKRFILAGCTRVDIVPHPTSFKNGIYVLFVRRYNDVCKVQKYLYSNTVGVPFMRRKKEKFDSFNLQERQFQKDKIKKIILDQSATSIFTSKSLEKENGINFHIFQKELRKLIKDNLIEKLPLEKKKSKSSLSHYRIKQ